MRAPALLVLALAVPSAAYAQLPSDTAPRPTGRSLEERVAALPGTPTPLADVVRVALGSNLSLQSSGYRAMLADAESDVAGGAFAPSVALFGSASSEPFHEQSYGALISQRFGLGTRVGIDLQGRNRPASTGGATTRYTDFALTVTQPVLEGRNTADAGARAAEAIREGASDRRERSLEEAIAAVELGYWALGEAEALEAVLQQSHEVAEALLFRNRELLARGLVAEIDLVTVQGGVALRLAALIDARRARRDAAEALVFLAHGAGAARRFAEDTLPMKTVPTTKAVPEPEAPDALVERALAARRDASASRRELEGGRILRSAAQRAARPALDLVGGVGTFASAETLGGSTGSLGERSSWSVGFEFRQLLGNRTDRGSAEATLWAEELLRIGVEETENAVRREVREAVRGVRSGQARLLAADEAAALAARQLEGERQRLDLGLSDSFRVMETEENLVQAELGRVRARFDLARAVTLQHLSAGTIRAGYPEA